MVAVAASQLHDINRTEIQMLLVYTFRKIQQNVVRLHE